MDAVPVAVRLVKVPTDVNEEPTTVLFKLVPVNVPAAAVTIILAEPLKLTPLISLAVANVVAVAALPVVEPEEPLTLPVTSPVTSPTKLPACKAPLTSTLPLVFICNVLSVAPPSITKGVVPLPAKSLILNTPPSTDK